MSFDDAFDFGENPSVASAEESFDRSVGELFAGHLKDAFKGVVALDDAHLGIEGEDAIAEAFEDIFVVIFDIEDFIEELGIFERDGGLCGEGFEALFVFGGEGAAAFIEDLEDADVFAFFILDGHTEDGLCFVACFFIDGGVEAIIGVGIGDIDGLSGLEDGACDAEVSGEADLVAFAALCDDRPEFFGAGVVDEEGAAVGAQEFGGGVHDLLEEGLEMKLGGDGGGHLKEAGFFVAGVLEVFKELCALKGGGGLCGEPFEHP